jgi:hypothetical protein
VEPIFGEGPKSEKEKREYGFFILLIFAVGIPCILYMINRGPGSELLLIFLLIFVVVVSLYVQLRYHPPAGNW